MIKKLFKDSVIRLGLFPQIFFMLSPFKMYEFNEIMRDIKLSGSETVLDLGCGNGLQTMLIARKSRKAVGIDINENRVNAANHSAEYVSKILKRPSNTEFLCTRIEDGKFEDNSFDAVTIICVLEHIPNYEGTLKEVNRILKKGGQVVLSVDSLENIRGEIVEKHRKDHSVEKYFTADGLKNVLENAGFVEVEVRPILKSEYAKKLFIRDVEKGTPYGIPYALSYYRLSYEEHKTPEGGGGIFLVAKCRK